MRAATGCHSGVWAKWAVSDTALGLCYGANTATYWCVATSNTNCAPLVEAKVRRSPSVDRSDLTSTLTRALSHVASSGAGELTDDDIARLDSHAR